ncbi:hypothetical protein R1flu_017584 [Riccia fluitans]|uniref:Uncharacterized protein n=1 Tax=Riccia fluitans TaxID=41844 RepID=A0ABD1ZDE0_9MARC
MESRRGRRRFGVSSKYFPRGSSPTVELEEEEISHASNLTNRKAIKGLAELRNEVMASLEVLKKDMEHQHCFMVKTTEAHTAKLKKRVKQESDEASEISRSVDGDWKNFLADVDDDVRTYQESLDSLRRKADKAAMHFTEKCLPELMKRVDTTLSEMKDRYSRQGTRDRPAKARRFLTPEKGKKED